jgi:cell division protein FtsB
MSETTRAAWDDRNALARQCADLRDEADDLRRQIERLKDHISIIDDDRRDLCDELEKATGRDWTDEQARSWLS